MTLLPQLNFPGLLMTFRLQWNNSTTPWTREQITVKIYWLAGMLMSLSPLRMKTVFPFHFEGFLFSVFKNNDSYFCHLVREKKKKLSLSLARSLSCHSQGLMSLLFDSLIRTHFTHTLLPRKQYSVQDTGGTAEILYHSNTKQKKAQDDFQQSQLFLSWDGLRRKFTFPHINMIGPWKATMLICWHRKRLIFTTRAARTRQTQIHEHVHACAHTIFQNASQKQLKAHMS